MIKGGKLFDGDVQIALYPFEVMNITQGMNTGISHKGRLAIDEAGKDRGIDDMYAPFDCEVIWKKPNGSKTGIVITNTKQVLCANGKVYAPRQVNVECLHDNDTSDLWVGRKIEQGTPFYQEGTADNATGNHVHIMTSFGQYKGGYPLFKTAYGNWALKGQVSPVDVFFINDTIIHNSNGYAWKKFGVSNKSIKIGDKVRIVGKTYATGQIIPSWVKAKTLTVYQKRNGSVLLKEIMSWVNERDIVKV